MAIRADRNDAFSGRIVEAVDRDEWADLDAGRQGGVAMKQDRDTGVGDDVVKPPPLAIAARFPVG